MATGTAEEHCGVGKIIGGKYRIVRRLGEGGMGAVYEAEHTTIGTRVAIKVLRSEHALNDNVVRRFQQEARSAAKIGHPNIVGILDLDRDTDGSLYMVQELLAGIDLAEHLAQHGQMPAPLAVRLCLPVLSALSAAHARGVLHRDMKPANIFLAHAPDVSSGAPGAVIPKVIDFGIAKVLSGTDAGKTTDGTMMGTLAYMSPEQLYGDSSIDGRTDVWAMGIVLYELIAGACPFEPPVDMNIGAVARFASRVHSEAAPRIETRVPDIAPDLAAIIHQALATNRDARFQTMQEMYEALSVSSVARANAPAFASSDASTVIGLSIRPAPAPRASAASGPVASVARSGAGSPSSPATDGAISEMKRSGRKRLLLGAVFAALALVAGTVALVTMRGNGAVVRPPPEGQTKPVPEHTAAAPVVDRAPAVTAQPLPPPNLTTAERPDAGAAVAPASPPPRKHHGMAAPSAGTSGKKPVGSNGMPILGD